MSAKPALSPEQEQALSAQLSRDSAYVRESMRQMAERVGTLQARLAQMDTLTRRLAEKAGVNADVSELTDVINGEEKTEVAVALPEDWSAEGLGRELDGLMAQMSDQQDWLQMLDMLMVSQAGTEALVPTVHPVDVSYMSSPFGWRIHPITGRQKLHEGMDFAAPIGTPIVAASGGIVIESRYKPGYGKTVEIDHGNGLVTRYAHASSLIAKLGDVVEKGQLIARVGNTGQVTGAHLHFEVLRQGTPIDPASFLPKVDESNTLFAKNSEQEASD
ncbi:M23 family metallopeptidase [Paenalcaligenes sp. Me131]|uniref:M23 family metallopeptidase n=1 Tax=Paenalcaligenes sp. Me131 TaxID=3392636 RepID=UPI003D2A14DC